MNSSLEMYMQNCWETPIDFCLMGIVLIAAALAEVIIGIVRKKKSDRIDICVLTVVSMPAAALQNFGILSYGGFHVRSESEADAQTVRGEIVRMHELPIFEFPKIDGKCGYRITVDGVECITLIGEGLETGDYISVEYLPESRYVLRIEEIAAESDAPKSGASEE